MDATVPTTGATLKALLFLLAAVFIPTAVADQPLRVVTWNIETVGEFDSAQHAAALQVLARIDADVVAINEVSGTADGENLADLAFALDYPFTAIAPPGPFGSLRSAFLSAYPLLLSESWTAAELSLDASANDISREILEIVVDLPEDTADPRLLVTHLKSGSSNIDELRRAIDSYRLRQAAESNLTGSGPVIILGDLNRDIGDGAEHPERFTALPDPADLPRAFKIGSDIQSLLHPAEGLRNAPLSFLETEAVTLNALQLDGSDTTRPESGRRIDYILADRFIAGRGALAQVYDCADEGLPGGLPLAGDSLAAKTCADAADHLPVFADLFVPTANASLVSYGDCVMNWAERVYAPLLRPVGTETQFKAPYHYRQYSETGAVVRISEIDNHVDYVNASGTPLDLGPLADWLTLANCEPLPTECLFDWGERFIEDNQFPPGTGLADVAFDLAYRYYPRTGNYLGVSASDEHVLGLIDRRWIDAGSYEIWMRRSRCR